ncbi:DNA circularization N-terminal domain-containing protein [Methylobacterium oryzisoli]|uniref:DNA circularization N-terminal domain-containing protein n=1 Tax=Methylobacterium oryzisoli TaxID=3385502 RepID=UPI0038925021
MSWRDSLRPASFRGVVFQIQASTKGGGRRGITHEFPKRDEPLDEDLGRRARRRTVTAYLIGDDYDAQADELEEALEQEGPGLLVHPTMGQMQARPDTWARTEHKDQLRYCVFEMVFVEARNTSYRDLISEPTQGAVNDKATEAESAAVGGSEDNGEWR